MQQEKKIRLALRSKSEAPRHKLADPPQEFPAEMMDDIVAEDVRMFRAELMDDSSLWIACYFGEISDQKKWDSLELNVKVIDGELVLEMLDTPESGYIDIDTDDEI